MNLNKSLEKIYSHEQHTAAEAQKIAQRISFAPVAFQVSRIMVHSGILEYLSEQHHGCTAEEIAEATGMSGYAVQILLEASLTIGSVLAEGKVFRISKTGWFLLNDGITRVNMDFTQDILYQGLFHLEDALRNGKPEGLKVFGKWSTLYEGLSSLPEPALKSWLDFDHFYSDRSSDAALKILFGRKKKIGHLLDVGGNTGQWAMKCVAYDPDIKVTILDLPQQIGLMKRNIAGKEGAERISGYGINLLDQASVFPSLSADIIWMSQFLDCFAETQITDICRKAAAAMDKDCRLYIMETFWDRQRFESAAYCQTMTSVYFTAMANGNSKLYRSDDMIRCIHQSGLEIEEIIDGVGMGHSILICKKKEECGSVYFGAGSMTTVFGDLDTTVRNILSGTGGLEHSGRFQVTAGLIRKEEPSAQIIDGFSRFESIIIHNIQNLCGSSGIRLSDNSVQIILSSTKGNIELLEKNTTTIDPDTFLSRSAEKIAGYFEAKRRPIVISNACISGISAFVVARNMMLDRQISHAVIIGCDVLSDFIVEGFRSFRSISDHPCRPYDAERDGLSLGEACGAVLLTTDPAEASHPLISLCGGAVTNDANHISGPSRTGDGLYFAIREAMRQAEARPEEIDLINAHGTATAYNDEMESKAVSLAGLSEIPINSVKGYLGHTLGASGVVETLLCIEELRRNIIFGTLGFSRAGTSCPLNLSNKNLEMKGKTERACLKTASGFGGSNAALLLRKSDRPRTGKWERIREATVAATYRLPESRLPFSDFIREEFRSLGESYMKFYKMSDLSKALYVAAARLIRQCLFFREIAPEKKAIILSNRSASMEADCQHQDIISRHKTEGASPAVFVYTLPNVSSGEICIRHKLQGDNTFFIEENDSGLSEDYARMLVEHGRADAAICGWCEKLGEEWNIYLKMIHFKNK